MPTQVWCCSQGRIKRVATCPQSPYICWSASEDGCVRRLDTREPHACNGDGSCRNVIIDLRIGSRIGQNHSTQCKCIDINPVRTEQIAVGALDAYARIYDARLCTVRSSGSSLPHNDPSCIALFSPGHINSSTSPQLSRRHPSSTVASTYLTFSNDGRELLVNLSGEQVYLYDVVNHQNPITYEFDKLDSNSVPRIKPILQTYSKHLSCVNDMGMKLMPFVSEPRSLPKKPIEEVDIDSEVLRLKTEGKSFYKEEKLNEALYSLNSAISRCPHWHILYFLRGTTLYSRKW